MIVRYVITGPDTEWRQIGKVSVLSFSSRYIIICLSSSSDAATELNLSRMDAAATAIRITIRVTAMAVYRI